MIDIEIAANRRRRQSSSSVKTSREVTRRCSTESADSFADYDSNEIDLSIENAFFSFLEGTESSSDEESESSSFDDASLSTSDYDSDDDDDDDDELEHGTDCTVATPSLAQPPGKRLCFGSITVRENAVTVGALSASENQCPLQLSWEHGPDINLSMPLAPDDSSPPSPRKLHRLTVLERRQRIAAVQGLELNQVYKLEFDNVMQHINEAMRGIDQIWIAERNTKDISRCQTVCP